MKTYYHIRHPNGVTLDWTEGPRQSAIDVACKEHAQVLEVKGSIATIIHEPAIIKPVAE